MRVRRQRAIVLACLFLGRPLGLLADEPPGERREPVFLDRAGVRMDGAFAFGPRARGGVRAEPGATVRLTLDARIQSAARAALAGRAGAVVILDARAGDVLAMHAFPVHEHVTVTTNRSVSFAEVMAGARDVPGLNRCAAATYAPGDLFALLAAMEAARRGIDEPRALLDAAAGADRRGSKPYYVALSERIGAGTLAAAAAEAGFGRPAGIPGIEEHAGCVETGAAAPGSAAAAFVSGQAPLAVTPVQAARWMAAIATGGALPAVRIVAESASEAAPAPADAAPDGTKRALALARDWIARFGAAGLPDARRDDARCLALAGGERDSGACVWILGYAPAVRPRYALAAAIEGSGTVSAADVQQFARCLGDIVDADRWAWHEPEWQTAPGEPVRAAFALRQGDSAGWRMTLRQRTGPPDVMPQNEGVISGSVEVEATDAAGAADLAVRAAEVDAPALAPEAGMPRPFICCRADPVGRVRLSPRGIMSDVRGFIHPWSLVTLTDGPVRVGTQWTGEASLPVSRQWDNAVASGSAAYRVAGRAEVDGHTWLKVDFQAELRLASRRTGVRKLLGIKAGEDTAAVGGARVADLMPDYPAALADLRVGDAIVDVAGMRIGDWPDIVSAVALCPYGVPLRLGILRAGERRTLNVTPKVTEFGEVESAGEIGGFYVFDATAGRLLLLDIRSATLNTTLRREDAAIPALSTVRGWSALLRLAYADGE